MNENLVFYAVNGDETRQRPRSGVGSYSYRAELWRVVPLLCGGEGAECSVKLNSAHC